MSQDLISRWLHPSNGDFMSVEPLPETWAHFDDQAPAPSFPRVLPPTHPREYPPPIEQPGLRDGKHASRIKYLLREWL